MFENVTIKSLLFFAFFEWIGIFLVILLFAKHLADKEAKRNRQLDKTSHQLARHIEQYKFKKRIVEFSKQRLEKLDTPRPNQVIINKTSYKPTQKPIYGTRDRGCVKK